MKTALLWLVIGLQSVWVIGTVVFQETQLAQGTPILLETRPVDPRDLLRGDYVILRYDISSVPVNAFTPPVTDPARLNSEQTVYVELRPEGEFSRLHRASWTPLTAEPGNVVLRGRALPQGFGGDTLPVALEVQYDIERYYVREGTGNPRGKLTVLVSVPKSGRGIVRQVFVDGVPYVEAMKGAR
jgi:uncharacterized membrane-anchored protein